MITAGGSAKRKYGARASWKLETNPAYASVAGRITPFKGSLCPFSINHVNKAVGFSTGEGESSNFPKRENRPNSFKLKSTPVTEIPALPRLLKAAKPDSHIPRTQARLRSRSGFFIIFSGGNHPASAGGEAASPS